jgi:diguanylate cyclase (GGDEF)-like protein
MLGLLSCMAACAAPAAVAVPRGAPPVARIAPDLPVYPQNFAVVQDARGVVYLGNADGVLAYDGERWTLVRTANQELVRSLAIGADGRVLVGGYNAFGWLERAGDGGLRYVDLTPRFEGLLGGREFYDIWDTVVAPEGVYFRALRDVFLWNPADDTVEHWRHEGRFGALFADPDGTLLQFRGEGFRRRVDGAWQALPGTAALAQLVPRLVPLRDGALLAIGADGRWHRIAGGMAAPQALPPGIPEGERFHDAIGLSDGGVALTTFEGWLYLVAPDLAGWRRFRVDSGHLSAVHAARGGGLLVSGDLALHRIGWPSQWTRFGIEDGLEGSVHALSRWRGAWFAATSGGLFRLVDSGGAARFVRESAAGESAMDLLALDDRRALLAGARTLSLLDGDAVRPIGEPLLNPRLLQRSRVVPGRVLVGTEYGLRLVDDAADGLRLSPPANEGLDMRVSSIAETAPDEIWYGTERHGLWRARLDAAGQVASQQRIGPAQGFETGLIESASVLRLHDGTLLASSRRGLFRWDGARLVADDLGGLAALRADEERLVLAQAADGTLWAHGVDSVFRRPPGAAWRSEPIAALRRGAVTRAFLLADGAAALASSHSLLLFDPTALDAGGASPAVQLRSVQRTRGAQGRPEPLPLATPEPLVLEWGEDALRFAFALPEAGLGSPHGYSARLLGFESQWSAWAPTSAFTYTRLEPGDYAFELRARDGAGRISTIAPYRFTIAPPWYATPLARVAWALLGGVAIALLTRGAVRWRTRRLAAEKRVLAAEVAARTRELADANLRLARMAHLDGLTGIANRRRLDEYIDLAWRQSRERARPVALVAIDVDHFKRYNDTRGHVAGDALLRELPRCLLPCLRRGEDLLGRFGGEEFLAVLPGADLGVAREVAESMRAAVEAASLGVTISIGVAAAHADEGPPTGLVERADHALYAAKHGGRNRVVAAGHDPGSPAPGVPANEEPAPAAPRRQAAG